MNYFEKLLEIKTGKKNLLIKAVYVPNSTSTWEWSYFIYYYDTSRHTFYINDLDKPCNLETRVSAINIIENIMTHAFSQETNSLINLMRNIQMKKKPKVICIYQQKKTNMVIIDKVNLQVSRSKDW